MSMVIGEKHPFLVHFELHHLDICIDDLAHEFIPKDRIEDYHRLSRLRNLYQDALLCGWKDEEFSWERAFWSGWLSKSDCKRFAMELKGLKEEDWWAHPEWHLKDGYPIEKTES